MIVIIDNFDSFTYNIAQSYAMGYQVQAKVVRNHVTLEELEKLNPSLLVIGPGPGRPQGAGISKKALALAKKGIAIFGICLGHQVIGEGFGASVIRASKAVHGKTSPIHHDGKGVFASIPQEFKAVRYHSLVLDPKTIPPELIVTAWTDLGEIMGVRHRDLPIEGVQFHPDSIGTEYGHSLFANSFNLNCPNQHLNYCNMY